MSGLGNKLPWGEDDAEKEIKNKEAKMPNELDINAAPAAMEFE